MIPLKVSEVISGRIVNNQTIKRTGDKGRPKITSPEAYLGSYSPECGQT